MDTEYRRRMEEEGLVQVGLIFLLAGVICVSIGWGFDNPTISGNILFMCLLHNTHQFESTSVIFVVWITIC